MQRVRQRQLLKPGSVQVMAAIVHPTYGTCTGCTQGKRVDKHGRIKPHTRTVGDGNVVLTVNCAGGGGPYAEVSRTEWNPRLSRWEEMPIEVAATVHMGDTEDEQHPTVVEAHPWTDVKAGHKVFTDNNMSLHLHLLERNAYASRFRAELRDSDGVTVKSEEVRDDGSLNGLALKWMQTLAEGAVKS